MNTYNEYDGYEPTTEDLEAYTKEDLSWLQEQYAEDFTGHPAYKWVSHKTSDSEDDCRAFTVYSNMYRSIETGHFSLPMDAIYHQFRMFGQEP